MSLRLAREESTREHRVDSEGLSISVFTLDKRRAEEQKSHYPVYLEEHLQPLI
jgi:hypothetical protein